MQNAIGRIQAYYDLLDSAETVREIDPAKKDRCLLRRTMLETLCNLINTDAQISEAQFDELASEFLCPLNNPHLRKRDLLPIAAYINTCHS